MFMQVCTSVLYLHASEVCVLTSVCKFNICPHKCVQVKYMSLQVCASVVYVHASVCKSSICRRKCVQV